MAYRIVEIGFHCALGLHHHNEYNSFNLADDLIEPCRAMIDQAAFSIIGNDINLSTKQRRELTGVLHKIVRLMKKLCKFQMELKQWLTIKLYRLRFKLL